MFPANFSRSAIAVAVFGIVGPLSLNSQATASSRVRAKPMIVASLHPTLVWQRTSPPRGQMEGPVLYQLLFSASGTPGAVPVFDTNPRHLNNSPIAISNGNVVIGGGTGLSIASNGIISFAPGQQFQAGSTSAVTNVTATTPLSSTGGATPNLTLSGIVPVFNGGTGLNASGLPGNYLRSNGATWNSSPIQPFDLPNLSGNYVDLSTNQTIGGFKNFINTISGGTANFGSMNLSTLSVTGGVSASSLNVSGVVSAAAINGDGAGLRNLTGAQVIGPVAIATNAAFLNGVATYARTDSGNNFSGNQSVAGNVSLSGALSLPNTSSASVGVITFGGAPFLHDFGSNNLFLGRSAGNFTMSGGANTAIGNNALFKNITGGLNVALGGSALFQNTSGSSNTASGVNALSSNTSGGSNTAHGNSALQQNSSGNGNTAIGDSALVASTGSNNVAIGSSAGGNLSTGDNNVYIANPGVFTEANTIRIGRQGTQTAAFIAGISGVTTSGAGVPVLIDTNGQLGTVSSSRRFKEGIRDMGEASNRLMQLRPVTFRYKPEYANGNRLPQYGLIAEEVANVYPDLVQYSPTGQANTVLYHLLTPMLLNELQKQHSVIAEQEAEIAGQQKEITELNARLARLEALVGASTAVSDRSVSLRH